MRNKLLAVGLVLFALSAFFVGRGYAQEDVEAPTVEVPLEKQQLMGVRTGLVKKAPLDKTIRTVGIVEADETRRATINTKVEGWLERLYVDYEGRFVKKGEPLAEIYSPELLATQEEFLKLLKWADISNAGGRDEVVSLIRADAQSLVEAARNRLRLLDISEEQINGIEKTGVPLRTLIIYSPVSGYVVDKMALQGMRVMPGDKLFDISDITSVWVLADIYEYELPLVKEGQQALITLSYLPGRKYSSKIDYIYPTLSGRTRTAKARFTLKNPKGELKPKMYANVEIRVALGSRLLIPQEAVIDTGERQIVYVDRGEGLFEPREVVLGLRGEEQVEVLKGLKEGEKIAISGAFLIDSEAKLTGVVK